MRFLGFDVGPYRVDRALADGEHVEDAPERDVPAAVERTLARYAQFAADPERAVWHAVRRAVISHLMTRPSSPARLAAMPWVRAAAARLGTSPDALIAGALAGLRERGAVVARNGVHATTLPHETPGPLTAGAGDWLTD